MGNRRLRGIDPEFWRVVAVVNGVVFLARRKPREQGRWASVKVRPRVHTTFFARPRGSKRISRVVGK